jgi:hypothetical protein
LTRGGDVDGEQGPVGDHPASGHPHVGDVAPSGGVDDRADRVVAGRQVGSSGIEHDQVGLFANLERSQRVAGTKQRCPANRGRPQHLVRCHGGRIAADPLVDQGGEAHDGKQVEVVGGRRAVGAQPDHHAGGEQGGDGGDARAQLEVGCRAVGNRGAGGGDGGDLGLVEVHGVGEHDVGAEQPQRVEERDGPHAPGGADHRHLTGRLRSVGVKACTGGAGSLGHQRELIGVDRVGGVGVGPAADRIVGRFLGLVGPEPPGALDLGVEAGALRATPAEKRRAAGQA